ncbi:STAS domain-containing protein [Streptomyces sp. NPDC048663]|uniref:STAS domain-containing protein n=1 Tax=Streptomyces sp. NPDC048663 TaxID=3155638 RepID=UPI003419734B
MSENPTEPVPSSAVRMVGGATVMTLHGEIDLATSIPLMSRLDARTAGPCPDLVLDLRPVSFIDCAGLSVLCRALNRVRARHGRLRLVTDSVRFRRILRAAGLGEVFELQAQLPEPLAPKPVAAV